MSPAWIRAAGLEQKRERPESHDTQITWTHVEISLASFLMIVGMPFTFSITTGAMLGVVSYVVVMVCRRRAHLVDPALYLLAAVFVLNAALGALT